MIERFETAIVGGGQAGLATSYWLRQQGREHIILEQDAQAASAWRHGRWDSFTLVIPNWAIRLPGAEYEGDDPDGFMSRDEIVAYLETYADRFKLPLRYNVRAVSVEPSGGGYLVRTAGRSGGAPIEAANVVIATGSYQGPSVPDIAGHFPPNIAQLHSSEYRNPHALAPGAVLVVGAGQSGCQIAEELYQSGLKVYLSVGRAPHLPRRYRGRDIVWWADRSGFFDRTVDRLRSPRARFAANPQLTGRAGGHTINLHQFARDGVTLLGHVQAVQDGQISLAPDLYETLAAMERVEADELRAFDVYATQNRIDAPEEKLPQLDDGYRSAKIRELDLEAAGITTVIWATGYRHDYSLVKLPVCDETGYPRQQRGVTEFPGLYFVGLHWLYKAKSDLLIGVGEDAAYVVSHIVDRIATHAPAMPSQDQSGISTQENV